MSGPKFQSRDARTAAVVGMPALGSPWDSGRQHKEIIETVRRLPADMRWRYAWGALARRERALLHGAYLHRTGGNTRTVVDDVPLIWNCCGREELLPEVHYDRHGDLRPEDRAIILARSYYHQC